MKIETLHTPDEFIAWMEREGTTPDLALAQRLQYPVSFSDEPWTTEKSLKEALSDLVEGPSERGQT
jgi:hypothetical protein